MSSFREEAIRRAEEAGYYPAEGQRPINWDTVEDWAKKVQEPGFAWRSWAESGPDEFIILGENKAIASGLHRILGGLIGDNPVPEEALTHIRVPLPTQPW
jgi:hypothetical protein